MKHYRAVIVHDRGRGGQGRRARLTVPATDEQAARELICELEGCPPSAIGHIERYLPPLTIHDIKRLTAETPASAPAETPASAPAGCRFFSRENMRAAGQRLSDFRVSREGERYLITAPRQVRDAAGRWQHAGYTARYYNPDTGRLEGPNSAARAAEAAPGTTGHAE